MRSTTLLAGVAVALIALGAVGAPLYFFAGGPAGRALAAAALVTVAVAAFVALGWADRRETPYW